MQKFSFNLLIKTRLRNKQNNLNFEDKKMVKKKKTQKEICSYQLAKQCLGQRDGLAGKGAHY